MATPPTSLAQLLLTYLAMLALLAIIATSTYMHLGHYAPWLQLGCAFLIIALLGFLWMSLSSSSVATRLAAFIAILFLFIMMFLSFNDYLTRRMDLSPFKAPPSLPATR
jgi:caa(3)-type oxidase subunit IV